MTALTAEVTTRTERRVKITYISRHIAKWWNARRQAKEPMQFTGWYWMDARRGEAGPFKSRSACVRDAYYVCILEREAPALGASTIRRANADAKRDTNVVHLDPPVPVPSRSSRALRVVNG